ncbi:MAG: prolyl oligopeptidase family serine peptidase [Candidatus Njordarchaeia archaeon]
MSEEDQYVWMENLNDEKVLDFINRENLRLKEYLGELPSSLEEEIKKYFFVTTLVQAQLASNGFFVLKRFRDRYILERYNWDLSKPQKILDSKELGEDTVLLAFKYYEPANQLAYWTTVAGSDIMKVRVIDLESREVLDELEGSIWGLVFLSDNRYYYAKFYRSEKTPDGVNPPAERILLRENGEESVVFGEGLESNYFISLKESLDREKALLEVSYGWNEGKLYGGKLDDPSDWKLLYDPKGKPVKMVDYVRRDYYAIGYGEKGTGMLLRIGENGEIQTITQEGKHPLNSAIATRNEILLEYLVDAVSHIKAYSIATGKIEELFKREYFTYRFHHSDANRVLINRTTFWMPFQLILYDSGKTKTLLEEKIEGEYEVSERFAKSHDGTKIHYFTVKKKDAQGKVAYVYGYGGFAISLTPIYIFELMKLLEDGYTYVLTNLRGGSEYGDNWHRDGMLLKKINVFQDYLSVLSELKEEGYKTIASGGSNGGLLVGASLNINPNVIDVALIGYPVLDMLRFHKLYIGKAWVPEYGNPEDEKFREYLRKYSPYHNIDPNKKYPPTLVYTGLHDDRVHPAHALKYVAKLREIGAPVYLRVETKSGHMGSTPETRLKERADILAFIYKTLNLEKI